MVNRISPEDYFSSLGEPERTVKLLEEPLPDSYTIIQNDRQTMLFFALLAFFGFMILIGYLRGAQREEGWKR